MSDEPTITLTRSQIRVKCKKCGRDLTIDNIYFTNRLVGIEVKPHECPTP